jgi:CheY-like chemotaxis protein
MVTRRRRILVIDDQEIFLRVISAALRSRKYAVRTVTDALDGIELLQREMFDLVIVDMMMPRIGGLLAIEVIRREHHDIPILVISGYYDKLSELLNRADIDGILSKPMNVKVLKSSLNDIFVKKNGTNAPRPKPSANSLKCVGSARSSRPQRHGPRVASAA